MKTLLFCIIVAVMTFIGLPTESVTDSATQSSGIPAKENPAEEGMRTEDLFETAVSIIKKYEGLHSPRHWPLVGYGHKVLPGEKFTRTKALSQIAAEKLLRADLRKLCRIFRSYGPDSLIMATLAYNIGHGAAQRSTVAKKLKDGNRDIRENYLAHCRYRGKKLSQLQQRRVEEFEYLFLTDTTEYKIHKPVSKS